MRIHSVLTLILILCLQACGKKSSDSTPAEEKKQDPITNEFEEALNKENVVCLNGQACSSNISKIVVIDRKRKSFKYCTGFLVSPTIMATSSSCLTEELRRENLDCSLDVHFFFPKTSRNSAERIGCQRVLQASAINEKDVIETWRDDVAFLELSGPINNRSTVGISREGLANQQSFEMWSVDQVDATTGLVTKKNCESVHQTYINPLVTNEYSPNMVMAGCEVKNGSTGSPIIDKSGNVRAIVSQSISTVLLDSIVSTGLLKDSLHAMSHATNLACAPNVFDQDMKDEKECTKDLPANTVLTTRTDILSTEIFFNDQRLEFEKSLKTKSRYLNFGVTLNSLGDIQETMIYVKCFKPLRDWLQDLRWVKRDYVFHLTVPKKTFRRVMDRYGRVKSVTIREEEKKVSFQFSVRDIRNFSQTTLYMWGDQSNRTWADMGDRCSADLLL